MLHRFGFSLLEILITLFLIGIAAAIIIPSQKSFLQSSHAKIAGSQLFHAIQVARNEALVNGKSVTLSKAAEWRNGYLIKMDNKILYSFRNSISDGNIYWRSFPLHRDDLEFLPTGFSKVENGTFWFCFRGKKNPAWAIMLNQGGRARMTHPDQSGKIYDGRKNLIKC